MWGAVGFQNQVSDSPRDKRDAKKKFADDLEAALKEKPDLKGFVFFTNVDLTPGELQELETYARTKGISHLDIYGRERIRITLDSPEGLASRIQYLQIPLSDAEQAAFFARFGNDIEAAITRGFDQVDVKLARLEFLQECSKPLRRLAIVLDFDLEITPDELGPYRVLVVLQDLGKRDPHPCLCIAGREAYPKYSIDGREELRHGHQHIAWSVNPDSNLQATIISFGETKLKQLFIDAGVSADAMPFRTLGSLDDQTAWVYCTPSLLKQLTGLGLVANDYVLFYEPASEFASMTGDPLVPLPIHLTERPSGEGWVSLMLKGPPYPEFEEHGEAMPSPPLVVYRRWNIAFSSYTPWRVPPAPDA
ncbi:MAG: hypothetical protein HYY64_16675 [Candidatus Rokubacteria bacterium]|nr:hypothetical protein [Candidatus Rokubacteria bacterium]